MAMKPLTPPNRRRLLGALGRLAGGTLLLPALWPLPLVARTEAHHSRRLLMGTWVDLSVADSAQPGLDQAVQDAFDTMGRLAGEMSRFAPDSRLAELNRQAGRRPVVMPAGMLSLLHVAQRLNTTTAGAFDITVGRLTAGPGGLAEHEIPDDNTVNRALIHIKSSHLKLDTSRQTAYIDDPLTQLDLGGIAKLPILEAGLNVLARRSITGAMLNGGGDVLCSARADGQPWRIGLRNPAQPDRLLAVLPLRAGAVASSGDYERYVPHQGLRYHHIIDPATGRPSRGVHGVSLVAAQVAQVNGLGTAAMVAGMAQGAALLQQAGVRRALMMGSDGQLWVSSALAQALLPPTGTADRPWPA